MTDYAIAGPPTITLATFTNALAHRSSPAYDEGSLCWATLLDWGCDPNVALGFFVNESNAGRKGIAVQTKNWGNLREGPGQLKEAGGFAWYATWVIGLNDWCKLLRGPLYEGAGLLTVSQVTPRYAPGTENDPVGYAAVVNFLCAEWQALSKGGTLA